ncbi:hypothetical protein SAMN06295974_1599 [Plantibacter flavus]|uniref:Uncharacterized protein n=1 Tax=Plantibacter flavus TaxID=150123 RepID=A0A3N2C7W7_9MICO|nr:hypothetical protein [Plantibacter flavus]ROR83530.1 hypothetical protein EDD42_3642 [Plantibacter flavus]SMG24402.1 hypothetical protein SAMN06295974_1599 [Plantibacter flavus]
MVHRGPLDDQIRAVTKRLADAHAMVDGSISAGALAQAARADAATRDAVSSVLTGVGIALAPVTLGASGTGSIATVALIEALSLAAQAGGEALWATEYAKASEIVRRNGDAQYIEAMRVLGCSAATLLGVDLPFPDTGKLTLAQHRAAVTDWYAHINEAAVEHPDPAQRMSPDSDLEDVLEDYVTRRWGAGS